MSLGHDIKASSATTDRPTIGCPINQLPNELLIYIFLVGGAIEQEEMDGWEDDSSNSEKDKEDENDGDDPLNIGPTSEALDDRSGRDTVSSSFDSGLAL
jgi:hypothetical protein